jgi:ABC-2 type transport system ATP-binding protein
MVGLLRPTSGSIHLFGHDVVSHPHLVPDMVAYFSQRVASFGTFTFYEVLQHAGILRGLTLAETKKKAAMLVEYFLCDEFVDKYLLQLSGGERRLALLLSTLMSRCPVLVLDEPTNDLDPQRRRLLWRYLFEENRNKGTTVILVTHNVLEAEAVVDRVIIMDAGQIHAQGTPGELKASLGDQAKVIVTLRSDAELRIGHAASTTRVHGRTWQILTKESQVVGILGELLNDGGLEAIDRFQMTSCSLEDVYVALTGRNWDVPITEDA